MTGPVSSRTSIDICGALAAARTTSRAVSIRARAASSSTALGGDVMQALVENEVTRWVEILKKAGLPEQQ
jgi:hypothetical protein